MAQRATRRSGSVGPLPVLPCSPRSSCSRSGFRWVDALLDGRRPAAGAVAGRIAARRGGAHRRIQRLGGGAGDRDGAPRGAAGGSARRPVRRLLERSTYLVLAMPGVVIALALSYFAERYGRVRLPDAPLLIVCYAILFFPLALVGVRASVA